VNTPDARAYRVSLVCACQNDVAYGFGTTLEEARATAEHFFHAEHGKRAKFTQIVNERAVTTDNGASYYAFESAAVRFEISTGVGRKVLDIHRGEPPLPLTQTKTGYVFESTDERQVATFVQRLADARHFASNRMVCEAADRTHATVTALHRAVF
jgi:hypothetical protein